jgi:MFS family permease
LFAALYFAEGAPIGFLWWALPATLREAGAPVERITALTAMLALPWAVKFVWAPLIDLSAGRRRWWIVGCQALMAATLAPLLWLDLAGSIGALAPWLLAHAVAASTQDAAIDAYAIAVAPEEERGRLSGAMQAGMLTGRWAFGAGLLLAAGTVGRNAAAVAMIALLGCVTLLVSLGASEPKAVRTAEGGKGVVEALREALRGRALALGLVVALLGGAAFETVGALAGPFLIDRGLSEGGVGLFFTATVGLMLAGALAGGAAADRWGPRRATGVFLASLAGLVSLAAAADWMFEPGRVLALGAVYFGIGLFTAASYALFMNLTDVRLGGTQFSLFMGATNLCESGAAFAGGRIVAAAGYPAAFLVAAAASLPALLAVRALRIGDNGKR